MSEFVKCDYLEIVFCTTVHIRKRFTYWALAQFGSAKAGLRIVLLPLAKANCNLKEQFLCSL
jgi:hypothetical protein